MAKVEVKNLEGKKVEELEVSDLVFGEKLNKSLLHQVYTIIASNQRNPIAHTKDRSEVSGSGKKPWRQKGTGNARVGQKRNPVWTGGGVSFGPTKDRNFKKDINSKMKQKAVRIALSEKLRSDKLVVVEKIALSENKTKQFAKALGALGLKGSILIGFSGNESEATLSSRNIAKTQNIMTKDLNVYDILNSQYLLISKESVKFLEDKFGKVK